MGENQNGQTDIEPLDDEALEAVAGGLAGISSNICCSCSACSAEPVDPSPS